MTNIEEQLENLASPEDRQKHLRGLAVLKQIGGENFGAPVSQLARFSEDLARFTIHCPGTLTRSSWADPSRAQRERDPIVIFPSVGFDRALRPTRSRPTYLR